MKVLVLGVTGMLGSTLFQTLSQHKNCEAWGTLRDSRGLTYFQSALHSNLISEIDVLNEEKLDDVFAKVKPDVVINCVGLIKQLAEANDPLIVLPINAMLPHRLARKCAEFNSRLIHISTDCVFSGKEGSYVESDTSDAYDLYGKSKFIGEVSNLEHAITLRTSIIGHEFNSHYALINWFLAQKHDVKGYTKAIFSGLPTIELSRVIRDFVLPDSALHGLYHVAVNPVNKYDLLQLVAEVYGKKVTITPDESLVIDRSLNASRFNQATGYKAPGWPELIQLMHDSYHANKVSTQ